MVNHRRPGKAYNTRAASRLQEILSNKQTRAVNQSWLMVYLDVITLLLATFILLINQPQEEFFVEKPQIKQERLQKAPVKSPVVELTDDVSDQLSQTETPSPEKKSDDADEIRKQLELIKGEDMLVSIEPGAISLELPESILFKTGQSLLLAEADSLLNKISPVLLQNEYPISVEGHTDNVPIFSPQFPSNWELSSARASVVIRKLGELGIPYSRLKAIGYADTVPLDSNATAEGRSRNRRVNIIIHVSPDN